MSLDPRAQFAATYDAAADRFDDTGTSFRTYFGEKTAALAGLGPGQVVLDVCSGTGNATLPAARAVGGTGRAFGLDLSMGLTLRARERAAAEGLAQVEFRHGDFDQAYFRPNSFDAVLCCFGLFFFPNIPATLQKMWRFLRPGGRLVATVWDKGSLEPGHTLFWDAVREVRPELYKATHTRDALAGEELLRGAFTAAGIAVEITAEARQETLGSAEDWWGVVMGSGYRSTVEQLTPEELARVRGASLAIGTGPLHTPVLYAIARK